MTTTEKAEIALLKKTEHDIRQNVFTLDQLKKGLETIPSADYHEQHQAEVDMSAPGVERQKFYPNLEDAKAITSAIKKDCLSNLITVRAALNELETPASLSQYNVSIMGMHAQIEAPSALAAIYCLHLHAGSMQPVGTATVVHTENGKPYEGDTPWVDWVEQEIDPPAELMRTVQCQISRCKIIDSDVRPYQEEV